MNKFRLILMGVSCALSAGLTSLIWGSVQFGSHVYMPALIICGIFVGVLSLAGLTWLADNWNEQS